MADQQINQYGVEATEVTEGSYFDADMNVGTVMSPIYETQKVPSSVLLKKLRTLDGFTVSVDDDVYPRAEVEYLDPSSDWKYAAGVQQIGAIGQASIGARDMVTTENFAVTINNSSVSIKHINTVGATTAAVNVESGKVRIRTTAQIAGTISVGDKVTAINVDGSIEFEKGSWTTAARPASPYLGQDGFNTTLSVREYWNGTIWAPY